MNRPTWTSAAALSALLGTGLFALNALAAPEGATPAAPAPPTTPAKPPVDPKTIWPAGLQALAGKYQFIQIASPGGLWARNGADSQQVSLNELTPAVRDRLKKAELVISDVELESPPEAREEVSPSRRGTLRFYSEYAVGRLTLRNLPGIGGDDEDKGEFNGKVAFSLNHQSHSNPSASGVLFQRMQQEATWGTATLDFADLEAIPLVDGKPIPRRRRPDPARSTTQRPEASSTVLASYVPEAAEVTPPLLAAEPAKPKPAQPSRPAPNREVPEEGDHDPLPVITNARVLRSGIEIVAFVNWQEQKNGKTVAYNGSVRLIKMDQFRRLQERLGVPPASGVPPLRPPVSPRSS